jgi:osmotically-inducible protein OsmY
MKTSSKKALASIALFSAALGLGVLPFTAGCAATPTQESTGEYVDDATITTKVKAALVHDPVVKALDVSVETFKGIVQLSGFVNTDLEKSQAGNVAATIKGVVSVKNNIVVK